MMFESVSRSGWRRTAFIPVILLAFGLAACSSPEPAPVAPAADGGDAVLAATSLTVLEGHLRASKDLSDRGRQGMGPDPALDLKRAGKHAAHPHHELLTGSEPHALALQDLLRSTNTLAELDAALTEYIAMSDQAAIPAESVEAAFQRAMNATNRSRQAIAESALAEEALWAGAVCGAVEVAAEEYAETAATGRIEIEEPGEPGRDGLIEYQDARGFIQAAYGLTSNLQVSLQAQEAFDALLSGVFAGPEPVDATQLTPAAEVDRLVQAICAGVQ